MERLLFGTQDGEIDRQRDQHAARLHLYQHVSEALGGERRKLWRVAVSDGEKGEIRGLFARLRK